jgi:hypothetical protein
VNSILRRGLVDSILRRGLVDPNLSPIAFQKHGLHTTDKKEWAVSTRFFFEGLWDFISVFVEDDKCKERVGGRGMDEPDENRDE